MWLLRQTQQDPLHAINFDGVGRHPAHQIREKRNKYLLDENKKPVFHVIKKLRRVRHIAPNKGKQKETKERKHKKETTSPGNIKCWKMSLSGHQIPSPGVMYARMKSNKGYKPGN